MSETSKVYFADFRCPSWRENLPQKLARLMMTAGFGDIDMEDKYVAIKMHFGEPGNLAYLRPNWARAVADLVKRGRQALPHRLQYALCGRPEKRPGPH